MLVAVRTRATAGAAATRAAATRTALARGALTALTGAAAAAAGTAIIVIVTETPPLAQDSVEDAPVPPAKITKASAV